MDTKTKIYPHSSEALELQSKIKDNNHWVFSLKDYKALCEYLAHNQKPKETSKYKFIADNES